MKIKYLLILFLFSIASLEASAKLSFFLGAKFNYSAIGTARVGWNNYEVGLLAPSTWGVCKRFDIKKNYYVSLGAGWGVPSDPALHTGVGFNFFDVLGFGLRGEVYTATSTAGRMFGAGTLGVSWNF